MVISCFRSKISVAIWTLDVWKCLGSGLDISMIYLLFKWLLMHWYIFRIFIYFLKRCPVLFIIFKASNYMLVECFYKGLCFKIPRFLILIIDWYYFIWDWQGIFRNRNSRYYTIFMFICFYAFIDLYSFVYSWNSCNHSYIRPNKLINIFLLL